MAPWIIICAEVDSLFILYLTIGCKQLESHYLVPGDILVLEGKKHSLPCDAVLIDGGCIVDEGMLTGESIPVTKTPLPHMENTTSWKRHSGEDYRRHVLFCGTEIIQTKPTGKRPVRAVLTMTESILPPSWFVVFVPLQQPVADTVVMALLLFTVSVPPAIPAALTTGIVYAQKRLKNKKIFCISPQRINICGQINLVCFDKVRHFLQLLKQYSDTALSYSGLPHPHRIHTSLHRG
uniref:P-type ATPase A domain-containing protein n=1 Tax=Pelusios castaneus TaxID=367368 RepID=A0A8C8S3S4_9SAUR